MAVLGLELMPQALQASPPWVPVAAFVVGGGFFIAVDQAVTFMQRRGGGDTARPTMIFFGAAVDLFSDGVMIGTGSLLNPALGLLM